MTHFEPGASIVRRDVFAGRVWSACPGRVLADDGDELTFACWPGVETLAPDGLAVVSYNVLPGWHLRSVVRDICLSHVGGIGAPRERVAAARDVLRRIADTAPRTHDSWHLAAGSWQLAAE